jgi:predicted PurR-regulated permease PerM
LLERFWDSEVEAPGMNELPETITERLATGHDGSGDSGPVVREQSVWRASLIGALAIAVGLGTLAVLWLLAAPLAVFFVAIVIAQALLPAVRWLENWLPRVAAVIAIYVVLLLLLVGMVALVVPPLVIETEQAVRHLPQLVERLGSLINRFAPGEGSRLVHAVEPRIPDLVNTVLTPPMTAFAGAVVFLQVMFLSVYWLIALPGLHRFSLSLFPEDRQERVQSVLHEIGTTIGGYVRGTLLDALAVAALTYIGLLILGVPYPLILAVIAFLGELVPLIGPTVAEVPAVALGLLSSPTKGLIVLVFYVALQQVDGNVILPLIIRSQAKISPLLVTFAVFVGAWAAGIIGALIAIPLAAALQVLVVRIAAPAIRNWTGAESVSTAEQ